MQPEVGDEETEWEETSTRADARTEHHTREVGCVCSYHIDKVQPSRVQTRMCVCVCVSTNST